VAIKMERTSLIAEAGIEVGASPLASRLALTYPCQHAEMMSI
jgi:hypothetical protein